MATFKIEFSYLLEGTRKRDCDLFDDDTLMGAVHQAEQFYSTLTTGLRIERIYMEVPSQWIEMSTDFLD